MTECEVWIMVDADGGYEVASAPDDLQAAAGLASRLLKITVKVPTPAALELEATVAGEPDAGELRVK